MGETGWKISKKNARVHQEARGTLSKLAKYTKDSYVANTETYIVLRAKLKV